MKATRALFTAGHLSLETARMPPEATVKAIQALTLPSRLEEHAAALSPKLTPGCACCPMSRLRDKRSEVPYLAVRYRKSGLGCMRSGLMTQYGCPCSMHGYDR